jgi:Peptidase family M28/PA domain
MKKLIYSLLAMASLQAAQAQTDDLSQYAGSITKEDLKKHLSILASDEYEGRETGKKGQKMAAEYLVKQFKALGLGAPVVGNAANPHLQSFELIEKKWGEVTMMAGGKKLEFLKDFYTFENLVTTAEEQVIFAGYGIESDNYSDMKGLDVKGKYVVVVRGEPKDKKGLSLVSKTAVDSDKATIATKLKLMKEKGAKGVVFISDNDEKFVSDANRFRPYIARPSLVLKKYDEVSDDLPFLFTSPTNAAQILGVSAGKMKKAIEKIAKKGQTTAGSMSGKIQITANRIKTTVTSENVLGFMEGSDLKEEILVVTAHYDHIGIVDGQINNGADDDGSGTSTVLEIAEAFSKAKAEGKKPRRSILFMLVAGEEKGLLGSEFYSDNPVFPLKNTITNLNIDMVGRVDKDHEGKPNYVYLIGTDMLSSELHQLSEETGKKYAPEVLLDYKYNSKDDPNRFYYRSDHYNFAKHGIPVIFYFNGTHEDYHQPGDDVEKINFDKMEKIGRLVFATAWQLANRDKRVVVDKQVEADE